MPSRVPTYLHFKPRNLGYIKCCEVFGDYYKHYFPGPYNSPESVAAYRAFLEKHFSFALGSHKDQDPSVLHLVDRYLDFANVYYGGGSHYKHALVMVACLRDTLIGDRRAIDLEVKEFTPKALKAIQRHMASRKAGPEPKPGKPDKRTKTWSRTHVNAQIARIVRMFRWGVAEELVPPDVLGALREVPGLRKGRGEARETGKVKPVDWDLVLPVLKHLTPVLAAMVDLQWWTGMRSSNICSMRPGDIKRDGEVWEYRPRKHKTQHHDHELVVMLGPRAQKIIAPFLERPSTAFLFSPRESDELRRIAARKARKASVQPSQQNRRVAAPRKSPGEKYDAASYRRAIKYAIKRANKEAEELALKEGMAPPEPISWHPHRLRHTRGTEVRKRYQLEGTRVALGQATVSAAEIYAEQDLDLARKIAREMG